MGGDHAAACGQAEIVARDLQDRTHAIRQRNTVMWLRRAIVPAQHEQVAVVEAGRMNANQRFARFRFRNRAFNAAQTFNARLWAKFPCPHAVPPSPYAASGNGVPRCRMIA